MSLATTRRRRALGWALGRRSGRSDGCLGNDLRGGFVGGFVGGLRCELRGGADEEGIRSDGLELEVALHCCCHC